ncbi:glycosyltransferase family 4 protein [Luminiphilus sp.]|nr:glycosyltransferase family 4 protein [Luminiphilus sp.]
MTESSIAETKQVEHVVMLVNNPCVIDSRVIKSAEAVAKTGRRVTVVCRQARGLAVEEERGGVHYLRIAPLPHYWTYLWRRIFGIRANTLSGQEKGVASARSVSPLGFFVSPLVFTAKIFFFGIKLFHGVLRYTFRLIAKIRRFILRLIAKIRRFILRYRAVIYPLLETNEFEIAAEPYVLKLDPDLIHAHDLTTLPLGGRLANSTGAKLIYDSHELEMHRNATYTRLAKLRRRHLEKKYIKKADRVITVSESIADHLRDDYKIDRPHVIMNTPLFDKAITPTRDVRTDLNLDTTAKLAIYVGSVTINRGIEQIVGAMVHAPDLHFVTVGPRRPATESDVAALASDLGVRDRLHFIDPVQPEEVVGYIRTAGVSVLPIQNVCLSYYYCMPNKLMESVFAGIPVAVADLLEMRRFVDAYQCGVVMDETEPKAIAHSLIQVLENRERYIPSSGERDEIARQYGWPSQAGKLRSIYDDLLPNV